ncbi:MerR family transcriptional regulator [Enterococcus quebecensis]|uniref:MerR family transcriptional regulator n=1 Tax=Enterococcus quebecensis TaxID=903983 RepID=A0A1E5GTE5_9ENTE|nr:MerR family transcriptional regulator [Enterococcus quebecensis]OEG15961.1 MerR family transcriptional regulator [Enterococcus quebecensis]OJG74934.1 hypothetical protein RV12_GL001979 [Enterococcus quebecensis]
MNYNIGKFSELSGFSIDTLRYYEKEGLIITDRDHNNRRIFSERDITWIEFIKKLKMTGMKLKDIKLYAQLRYEGDETIQQRLDLLFNQSETLNEQKKEIDEYRDFLQNKIGIYQNMLFEQNQKVSRTNI